MPPGLPPAPLPRARRPSTRRNQPPLTPELAWTNLAGFPSHGPSSHRPWRTLGHCPFARNPTVTPHWLWPHLCTWPWEWRSDRRRGTVAEARGIRCMRAARQGTSATAWTRVARGQVRGASSAGGSRGGEATGRATVCVQQCAGEAGRGAGGGVWCERVRDGARRRRELDAVQEDGSIR